MKSKKFDWENGIVYAAVASLTGLFFDAKGFDYVLNYFTMFGFIMSLAALGIASRKLYEKITHKKWQDDEK